MKQFSIYWLPVIICAGIIFSFSAQPYENQDLRPTLSSYVDLSLVHTYFSNVSFTYAGKEISIQSLGEEGFVEFFIRKGAHLMIYLLLGALLYRALVQRTNFSIQKIALAVLLAFSYACSDEFHQSLTPNRTPLFHDVMLDTFGAVIGIVIMVGFYKVRKK
ncbi:VanZ family protein [Bacillus taeanensis]|nr:VanZ family protein [Bacillus taeanensis]